jgi:hypothetical protein
MNDNQTASGQQPDDFELLRRIVDCLRSLDDEGKVRLLKSAITFLRLDAAIVGKISPGPAFASPASRSAEDVSGFSGRTEMTPKQFLLEKQPKNDIERVACLAYYFTHYRNMPAFKTLDISQLNTEAAQPKFSNPSVPVDNARQRGFLVVASGGKKQLGALGEQFVQALPNREAAKDILKRVRRRRPRKQRNGGDLPAESEVKPND